MFYALIGGITREKNQSSSFLQEAIGLVFQNKQKIYSLNKYSLSNYYVSGIVLGS